MNIARREIPESQSEKGLEAHWNALALAIIEQAVEDYKRVLKKGESFHVDHQIVSIKNLEKFFDSKYFEIYASACENSDADVLRSGIYMLKKNFLKGKVR